jgi:hypothetical protein
MNPNDGRALVMRAVFSAMNGHEERARQELDQALQMNPRLAADVETVRRRMEPE